MFLFMYSIHRIWSPLLWSSKSVNTFLVYCKNSYGEVLNSDFESFSKFSVLFCKTRSTAFWRTHCIIASPPWSADWVSWTPRWSCSRIDSHCCVGLRPVSSKKFLETDDSTIHTMHFFFVNDERDKLLAVTAKQGCHKRFYWTITTTIFNILNAWRFFQQNRRQWGMGISSCLDGPILSMPESIHCAELQQRQPLLGGTPKPFLA